MAREASVVIEKDETGFYARCPATEAERAKFGAGGVWCSIWAATVGQVLHTANQFDQISVRSASATAISTRPWGRYNATDTEE